MGLLLLLLLSGVAVADGAAIQDRNGQPVLLAPCDSGSPYQQFRLAPSGLNSTDYFQSADGSRSGATHQPFCVSLDDCRHVSCVQDACQREGGRGEGGRKGGNEDGVDAVRQGGG